MRVSERAKKLHEREREGKIDIKILVKFDLSVGLKEKVENLRLVQF